MARSKFQDGVNATATMDGFNWELNDQYGHVRGTDIIQNGINTGYRMVYKEVLDSRYNPVWTPIGSVSEDWQPVPTSNVVELAMNRLMEAGLVDNDSGVKVKQLGKTHKSTTHRVDIKLNREMPLDLAPRDESSPWAGPARKENYFPQVTLWNGYSGCCSLQATISMMRQVCSNGLVVPVVFGRIRSFHGLNSTHRFLNELSELKFLSKLSVFEETMKKMADRKLEKEELDSIMKHMGKRDKEQWQKYPDQSTIGLVNFLSYRQTHDASVLAETRYQQAINQVFRMAA